MASGAHSDGGGVVEAAWLEGGNDDSLENLPVGKGSEGGGQEEALGLHLIAAREEEQLGEELGPEVAWAGDVHRIGTGRRWVAVGLQVGYDSKNQKFLPHKPGNQASR